MTSSEPEMPTDVEQSESQSASALGEQPRTESETPRPSRFGTVAIVGRTNVGKSTFLNACLGEKLAIVSPLPQTTRDELLGVVNYGSAESGNVQIAFTDTPGLHRPKTELGRRMNARALDSVRSHDLVVFMTDVLKLPQKSQRAAGKSEFTPAVDLIHADDRRLLKVLPEDVPCLLVLNKVDTLKDKRPLLPLIAAFNEAHQFSAIVPVSVLRDDGVNIVLDEISKLLPERGAAFENDELTDKPMSFFVREYVREQVMLQTRSEVPHAVAVTVDRFEDGKERASITATIHVEKPGQKAILVGRQGAQIRDIGTAARQQLQQLIGREVYLELFVRVTERWKDVPRQLSEMGYDGSTSRELKSVLPELRARRKPTQRAKPRAAAQSRSQSKSKSQSLNKRDGAQPKAKQASKRNARRGGRK